MKLPESKCIKCGNNDIVISYHSKGQWYNNDELKSNIIACHCRTCHYEWNEIPLDEREPTPPQPERSCENCDEYEYKLNGRCRGVDMLRCFQPRTDKPQSDKPIEIDGDKIIREICLKCNHLDRNKISYHVDAICCTTCIDASNFEPKEQPNEKDCVDCRYYYNNEVCENCDHENLWKPRDKSVADKTITEKPEWEKLLEEAGKQDAEYRSTTHHACGDIERLEHAYESACNAMREEIQNRTELNEDSLAECRILNAKIKELEKEYDDETNALHKQIRMQTDADFKIIEKQDKEIKRLTELITKHKNEFRESGDRKNKEIETMKNVIRSVLNCDSDSIRWICWVCRAELEKLIK